MTSAERVQPISHHELDLSSVYSAQMINAMRKDQPEPLQEDPYGKYDYALNLFSRPKAREGVKPINKSEHTFLKFLRRSQKVILDWGGFNMWAVVKDGETNKKHRRYMQGERFIELFQAPVLTTADTVFVLLLSGVDVELRNTTHSFETIEKKEDFLRQTQEQIQNFTEVRGAPVRIGQVTFKSKISE